MVHSFSSREKYIYASESHKARFSLGCVTVRGPILFLSLSRFLSLRCRVCGLCTLVSLDTFESGTGPRREAGRRHGARGGVFGVRGTPPRPTHARHAATHTHACVGVTPAEKPLDTVRYMRRLNRVAISHTP